MKKSLHLRRIRNGTNCLNPITAEIKQDDEIEAGMLIGANCMKAIGPVAIRMEKH